MSDKSNRFKSFNEFYPFYLEEHADVNCRRLHFVGTAIISALMIWVAATHNWTYLFLVPVIGYGFAWVGHYFFEKNRPATFTYPVWSLMGDWRMFFDVLRGKVSIIR